MHRGTKMILFVGCGSLGSHIAVGLGPLVKETFAYFDDDNVEKNNIATSVYALEDVGDSKVTVLSYRVWLRDEKPSAIDRKTIIKPFRQNNKKPITLLIDTLDNPASRQLTICDIPTVHIGVGEGDIGSVVWDSSYQSPTLDFKRGENPICTNELGFYIINITATVAVKSILQYLQEGVKTNYYINGLNIKGVKND